MLFLKTLKKVENIILGKKNDSIKPRDHWKKYRKPKIK
tara:strand:- start:234 stop:347 length:114 start_codon:yes stop_codon:yes gene_type:complete